MADENISVRFGGSTTDLRAAAAEAKRLVQDQGQATRAQNTASKDSYAGLNATMKETNDLLRQVKANTDTTAAIAEQARSVALLTASYYALKTAVTWVAEKDAAIAVRYWSQAYADLTTNLVAVPGKFLAVAAAAKEVAVGAAASMEQHYVAAAYAERSARLYEQAQSGTAAAIGQNLIAFDQLIARMQLTAQGYASNQVAALAAAGSFDRFQQAIGNRDATSTLVDFTAQLERIPGLSHESASGIEAMFAGLPNYSRQSNDVLVALLQTMSRTGEEAVANAEKLTGAIGDTEAGGQKLGTILVGALKDFGDLQSAAVNLSKLLSPEQATALLGTMIAKLKERERIETTTAVEADKYRRTFGLLGSLYAEYKEYRTGDLRAAQDLAAATRITTENMQLGLAAAQAAVEAKKQQLDLERLLGVETTRAGRQAAAEKDIATLTSRQRRPDPGAQGNERDLFIRTLYGEAGGESEEGQEAVANVIRNRLLSGYRGAQSYSDVINSPRQFSVWNEGDPAGDRASALDKESAAYKRLGEIADRVMSGQSADPTSGATSYYNPRVASPGWGADMTNVRDIGNHRFGNARGSPQVLDEEQSDAAVERAAKLRDTVRQIGDEKRGGSNADLAALDIAEKNVTAARDQVAEARQLVAARKQDLDAAKGGTEGAQVAARRALADAEGALKQREVEQAVAADQLKLVGLKQYQAEWLTITNAMIEWQQSLYAKDDAAWKRLQAQKLQAAEQYKQAVERQQGTATDRVQLANAQALAAGKRDEVAAAEALVTAAREDSRLAEDDVGRRQAALRIAQAEASLREKQEAALRAQTALKTVGMDAGDPERVKLQLAMIDELIAKEHAGSTKLDNLRRERAEAVSAQARQQAQEQQQAEEITYQNALRGNQEKLSLIRESANERRIDREQELQQTFANADARTAIERRHWQAVADIWREVGGGQYDAAMQRLATIDAAAAQRRQQLARGVNQAIAADYRQTFEQIGSSVSSSIMGMIERQKTFQQALADVLRSALGMFVQHEVKLAADWAALQAQKLAQTIAAETAQTATTAQAAAARTGITAGEASAGSAVKEASALKSIASSMAETYAGVFAWASPMLGPFAAVPAGLAAATVGAMRGLISYDKGAWSVPGNQVAQIHDREMIVPAGPAEALRRSGLVTQSGTSVSFSGLAQQAQAVARSQMSGLSSLVLSPQLAALAPASGAGGGGSGAPSSSLASTIAQTLAGMGGGSGGLPPINLTYHGYGRLDRHVVREHAELLADEIGRAMARNPSLRLDY